MDLFKGDKAQPEIVSALHKFIKSQMQYALELRARMPAYKFGEFSCQLFIICPGLEQNIGIEIIAQPGAFFAFRQTRHRYKKIKVEMRLPGYIFDHTSYFVGFIIVKDQYLPCNVCPVKVFFGDALSDDNSIWFC